MDQFRWVALPDPRVEDRILRVYESWVGTRYMAGQQAKGMAVDCVNLVGGVLDELFRRNAPTPIPRLAGATGIGPASTGLAAAGVLRRQFPSEQCRDGTIEPGDVIICRSTLDAQSADSFGHCVLAGVRPWSCLHAIPNVGVCWTGLGQINGVLRVYRVKDKESWL